MSSKPILFNTEMVKAILDGRKTQTRRVFSKTQLKYFDYAQKLGEMSSLDNLHENDFAYILQFSQYKVGDVLYVRETFNTFSNITMDNEVGVIYKADNKEVILPCNRDYECEYVFNDKWKPSIHMPKKYARIFLKVTNVGVERLQDISDEDCIKEGIIKVTKDNQVFKFCIYDKKDYSSTPWQDMPKNPQEVYKNLWNSTTKDGYKWEDNPYVFVYEFERIEKQ